MGFDHKTGFPYINKPKNVHKLEKWKPNKFTEANLPTKMTISSPFMAPSNEQFLQR